MLTFWEVVLWVQFWQHVFQASQWDGWGVIMRILCIWMIIFPQNKNKTTKSIGFFFNTGKHGMAPQGVSAYPPIPQRIILRGVTFVAKWQLKLIFIQVRKSLIRRGFDSSLVLTWEFCAPGFRLCFSIWLWDRSKTHSVSALLSASLKEGIRCTSQESQCQSWDGLLSIYLAVRNIEIQRSEELWREAFGGNMVA